MYSLHIAHIHSQLYSDSDTSWQTKVYFQRRNLSPIWTLNITVGERGQRDKWVDQKLNQVMILSRVRVKVGKKAVQGGEQAARQGDGQKCGQVVWQRNRQEGEQEGEQEGGQEGAKGWQR